MLGGVKESVGGVNTDGLTRSGEDRWGDETGEGIERMGDESLGGDIEQCGLRGCGSPALFRAAGHGRTVVPRVRSMIGMCVRSLSEVRA